MFTTTVKNKIVAKPGGSFISFQAFGVDFLEDKLKPFFKSDPVPENVSYYNIYPGQYSYRAFFA